jgi:hypothetical protein
MAWFSSAAIIPRKQKKASSDRSGNRFWDRTRFSQSFLPPAHSVQDGLPRRARTEAEFTHGLFVADMQVAADRPSE